MISLQDTWTDYLQYGKRIFYKKNTVVFQQGDLRNGFYYILKGIIKITSNDPGKGKRILDIAGPGYLIGDTDCKPYFSSAVCHNDSVLYYYSKQDYERLLDEHPETSSIFFRSLIQKQRLLLSNLNVTSADTEHQMAHSLLHLSNIYKGREIDLTQQEVSQYVGLTRYTVYNIVKKWSAEGIITVQNRKIAILDVEKLKEKLLGSSKKYFANK
ncbi:Crp/Fnr family transcriptional regulator [Siminovitchia sediminis]|uniref:Crp/Fnr family transcriptional regulator n=1 Tax=Siminovitchia sediminis TaxID=1274353 RepID=A0ABW4KJD6_9BACI